MSGFYLDVEELEFIQRRMGATRKQLVMAYNAAMRKTLRKLHIRSVAMMIDLTGAGNKKQMKKRTQMHARGGGKQVPRTGKIWFGLDDMPVSALEGTITSPPERERERDSLGRFARERSPQGATFTPRSSSLSPVSFPEAFMATFRGKESLYERIPGNRYLREVKVPIMDVALKDIETDIFRQANTLLMAFFKKELERLMA